MLMRGDIFHERVVMNIFIAGSHNTNSCFYRLGMRSNNWISVSDGIPRPFFTRKPSSDPYTAINMKRAKDDHFDTKRLRG